MPAASIVELEVVGPEYSRVLVPARGGRFPVKLFDEAVEETERRFLRSVELRLHADVSVGALLAAALIRV